MWVTGIKLGSSGLAEWLAFTPWAISPAQWLPILGVLWALIINL